ncbi:MAG TPA: DUF1269 domain-containing protein [Solirubrobacteraceae bacterium]|jgi:uncharacterized membrane protein|nr:DUF1269 domain-containing protein [Solirubrobacteraceae bacterium]
MSLEVVVLRFEKESDAVQRFARARDATPRWEPEPRWTRDVGFVERHHSGRLLLRGSFAGHYLDFDENDDFSQKDAGEGAVAGGLIGVLGGPPGIAVGLLVGGLLGGNLGSPDERESEPEAFVERLRAALPPESSALVMIAAPAEIDELLAAIGDGASDTVRRALDDEQTAAVQAALSAAPPSAPGP